MEFPEKWRETVDPFTLKFNKFKILEVLGYPHAGNDVFYVKGIIDGKEVFAFIKYARQLGADVKNEIEIISNINFDKKPLILDYNYEKTAEVLLEAKGERLSTIVKDNKNLESLKYLEEYGETLAKIHSISGKYNDVKDRKFFHIMERTKLKENGLDDLYEYLVNNRPKKENRCFVHGDFHYANVLWDSEHISCVLDYELSGIGNREFDIAWAIIKRPTQKFMTENIEIDSFLNGYKKIASFNYEYVKYYMAQVYSWFYFNGDDKYKQFVKNWLKINIFRKKSSNK